MVKGGLLGVLVGGGQKLMFRKFMYVTLGEGGGFENFCPPPPSLLFRHCVDIILSCFLMLLTFEVQPPHFSFQALTLRLLQRSLFFFFHQTRRYKYGIKTWGRCALKILCIFFILYQGGTYYMFSLNYWEGAKPSLIIGGSQPPTHTHKECR